MSKQSTQNVVPIEKIASLLKYYRLKLETANKPPIDYATAMSYSAKISVLEDLYEWALQNTHREQETP